MNLEFLEALDDLEREKHMSKDMLIEAIESALVSAYKKNYGTSQNVRVDIDRQTGDINVFMRRDIVEVVEDLVLSERDITAEVEAVVSVSSISL